MHTPQGGRAPEGVSSWTSPSGCREQLYQATVQRRKTPRSRFAERRRATGMPGGRLTRSIQFYTGDGRADAGSRPAARAGLPGLHPHTQPRCAPFRPARVPVPFPWHRAGGRAQLAPDAASGRLALPPRSALCRRDPRRALPGVEGAGQLRSTREQPGRARCAVRGARHKGAGPCQLPALIGYAGYRTRHGLDKCFPPSFLCPRLPGAG